MGWERDDDILQNVKYMSLSLPNPLATVPSYSLTCHISPVSKWRWTHDVPAPCIPVLATSLASAAAQNPA